MQVKRFVLLLVILSISGLFNDATAQKKLIDREYDFGVVAAYWLSGDVSVDGFDVEKDGSFMLRAFADAYLMPKFAMGGYFNYIPYSSGGAAFTGIEFGGALKGRFLVNPDFAIKPGINFGYRMISSNVTEDIEGLGINLSVEFQKQLETFIASGEIGFLSQPSGGNEDVTVEFAPIFYLGAGITF